MSGIGKTNYGAMVITHIGKPPTGCHSQSLHPNLRRPKMIDLCVRMVLLRIISVFSILGLATGQSGYWTHGHIYMVAAILYREKS